MGHWVVQSVLSGPIIVAGVALGINAVNESHGRHLNDMHKKLGVALFILYFVQLFSGALIHFVKSPSHPTRPAQNYLHAFTGILLIALAFWQVRSGYTFEYPLWTRDSVPRGVNALWFIWVVILPIFYLLGLILLKRQLKWETAARKVKAVGRNYYD